MLGRRRDQRSEREKVADFIFANSPDAYFVIDGGVYSDCNKAMEELMALPRDKLLGMAPALLAPERQPDGQLSEKRAQAIIADTMAQGQMRFEWLNQQLDGTPLPVLATLLRAEIQGRTVLIGFLQDLRATVALREAERTATRSREAAAEEQAHVVQVLAEALKRLANRDLTVTIDAEFTG